LTKDNHHLGDHIKIVNIGKSSRTTDLIVALYKRVPHRDLKNARDKAQNTGG